MRWFKHFADARHNSKLLRIRQHLGEAGYARAFKVLELVAAHGGSGEDFKPEVTLKPGHRDEEWLAFELGIERKELSKTMKVFADADFISRAAWRKKIIAVPAMLEYRDEFTRKKQAGRKAEPNQEHSVPNPAPSHQSQSRESDTEADGDHSQNSEGTASETTQLTSAAEMRGAWSGSDLPAADFGAGLTPSTQVEGLLAKCTDGRFDCRAGFLNYHKKDEFLRVLESVFGKNLRRKLFTDTLQRLMSETVDRCEKENFQAPPGWIRVLNDIRRELKGEGNCSFEKEEHHG